jgi:hypothetical protein
MDTGLVRALGIALIVVSVAGALVVFFSQGVFFEPFMLVYLAVGITLLVVARRRA